MTDIHNKATYDGSFPENKAEKALGCALDIRKFEIELYWKRATYFWSLIAAAFAGYFALSDSKDPLLPFIVSCIGVVLSVGWFQVNRGSKYWQSNWERHVDCLEDTIMGPLYKTTIAKEKFSLLKFWGGYPYSVSKVNQLISLFVALTWSVLLVKSFPVKILPACLTQLSHWILLVMTLLFVIFLFTLGCGGSDGKSRNINFKQSELGASDHG